jgi:RHS repeat-associated protein
VTSRSYSQRAGGNTWTNMGLKVMQTPGQITVRLDTASTGNVVADAVRALPASIATKVNYIFADHLGTPRVITRNTDNQIVWRWDGADPFGLTPPNENPNALGAFKYNPRFPGQLYDAETGLYYNYHRNYNPGTGRYAQSDPIGLQGGINTYAYTGGNPVNFSDPLGLDRTIVIPVPGPPGIFPPPIKWPTPGDPPNPIDICIMYPALCAIYVNPFPIIIELCKDKDPECHRARPWELKQAHISDEEEYKKLNGAVPVSHYDICKCKDGSIRIARVGQCGKTRDFWD